MFNINKIRDKLDLSKSSIEEFFYMNYLHIHMGRISGNNDIFHVLKRNWRLQNNDIFLELVRDAEDGEFDNVFTAYKDALAQLESF